MSNLLMVLLVVAAPWLGAAQAQEKEGATVAKMTLESIAFTNNGEIPRKHTCQGEDISPQLGWSNLPEGTRSLVLIVDDPDAPDPRAPKMTWVHWVLYNIPPTTTGLGEDAAKLPASYSEGRNDWGRTGYGGPCPPIGRHRYFHKLYALDVVLSGLDTPTKAELEKAMEGHVLEQAVLIGTYQKSQPGGAGTK
jgi:Raf kinase inhibitor-like YbhB/YbcL family protein